MATGWVDRPELARRADLDSRVASAHNVIARLLEPTVTPENVIALGGERGFRALVSSVHPTGVEELAEPGQLATLLLATRVVIAARAKDLPAMLKEQSEARHILASRPKEPEAKKASAAEPATARAPKPARLTATAAVRQLKEAAERVQELRVEFDRYNDFSYVVEPPSYAAAGGRRTGNRLRDGFPFGRNRDQARPFIDALKAAFEPAHRAKREAAALDLTGSSKGSGRGRALRETREAASSLINKNARYFREVWPELF